MKRKVLKSCVALMVVAAMGLTACGNATEKVSEKKAEDAPVQAEEEAAGTSSEAAEENFSIRVGTMPYYSGVPIQVIQDEGLDKKYGFEMEVLDFASGGPMAEALGAGEWDIGPIGAGGMTAISNYNARLIYDVESEMDGAWIMARPDSDIAKVGNTLSEYPDVLGDADSVKGATVLGTIGNISHYMAIDYCSKFGLELSDVNFLNMETSNVYTAFVSGQGDLACMGSPSAALKLLDEGYVCVGGLKQQGNPQQDCMLVSDDYYTGHPQECARFMAAWLEASAMLNADQKYEEEKMSKFYSEHGRTDFTDDDVSREAEWDEYTDSTNIDNKEIGAWMKGLISCYVDSEVMEPEVLDAMNTNVVTDIMKDAVAIYNDKK